MVMGSALVPANADELCPEPRCSPHAQTLLHCLSTCSSLGTGPRLYSLALSFDPNGSACLLLAVRPELNWISEPRLLVFAGEPCIYFIKTPHPLMRSLRDL